MQPMLAGFVDELIKLAEVDLKDAMREAKRDAASKSSKKREWSISEGGAPVSRNYLASALLGATTMPAVSIAGKKLQRTLHNREIRKALASTTNPAKKKKILAELQTGPLIGRARPDLPLGKRPAITTAELASDAARGGLMGSVVQMLRDRFSGEGRVDKS